MNADRNTERPWDVIIVGARCAGAATAMLAARAGLRVLVLDRTRHGSDTLSTHALMRSGVLQLERWGLLERIREAGTPPVRRTAFHYGGHSVEIEIEPRHGVDALYSPRRTVLDAVLQDAAVEAGATLRFETRMLDLIRDRRGRVRGVTAKGPDGRIQSLRAEQVVGADGIWSSVARLTQARPRRRGQHASSLVFGYWADLPGNRTHWHYGAGVAAGQIPTNDGLSCLFIAAPAQRIRRQMQKDAAAGFHALLRQAAPDLAASVAGQNTPHLLSFPGVVGHLRDAWGAGWALVGDAGCFRDPITAQGISDALRDAGWLAHALAEGGDKELARYESRRDEMAVPFFELTDEIASYTWDLPTVQDLHRKLSRQMKRHTEAILSQPSTALALTA